MKMDDCDENIGVSRNEVLDLVVTQAPGSKPYTNVPSKNGYNEDLGDTGRKFGNINVQTIDQEIEHTPMKRRHK